MIGRKLLAQGWGMKSVIYNMLIDYSPILIERKQLMVFNSDPQQHIPKPPRKPKASAVGKSLRSLEAELKLARSQFRSAISTKKFEFSKTEKGF